MKDALKDFIETNRDAFDNREPCERVWSRIKSKLPGIALWHNVVVWRAAAILLLAFSVVLLVQRVSPAVKKHSEQAQLQGEFSNLEKFYSEQIAEKVEWITTADDLSEEDTFTQDFKKLDAMYLVLREQMRSQPSEQVRDALVLNLLVRIDLLNQQIHKLELVKKDENVKQSSI
ncbi:MAG: hypothetical protein J0L66_14650 [Cytophagales bacterium]|nr:hypothetical protein [Cytophagales bacterium]